MPLPSSRMTKQPTRPERYFPGKALAEDAVSSDESDDEEEEEHEEVKPAARAPPPKATSFPPVKKPIHPAPTTTAKTEIDLEGFVTASESSSEGSTSEDEESEDSSEEEDDDSSSDDEPRRPMIAPKFIAKNKRGQAAKVVDAEAQAAEEERIRKEKADALLQAQIEKDAALRSAGQRAWDDEDAAEDEVDDTDGLDPEAEHAAWKLRELKRVQRDRMALIAKEKEREEIERRRNMTAEEREEEDRKFLDAQAQERDGKGKMAYMQKYFHKGAFFNGDEEQDEEVRAALQRDLAGARFEDETGDKSLLPEYMRIRDMTRLGKKGRTRYKDLKSEDTGRWGEVGARRQRTDVLDERFQPDDRRRDDRERTGANAISVGDRRPRDGDHDYERDDKRPRYS